MSGWKIGNKAFAGSSDFKDNNLKSILIIIKLIIIIIIFRQLNNEFGLVEFGNICIYI